MSKYKCPVCGAPHKDPVAKCRLCGQDMSSPAAVPVSTAGARQVAGPKKGIGVLIWIALGLILVILVGALVFGLTRDSETVSEVTRAIPGLNETVDGWVTIEDLDGGFAASMPPSNTSDLSSAQSTPPASGRWVGELGEETVVSITYYDVTDDAGQIPMNQLKDFAMALDEGRHGIVNQPMGETSFAGHPALNVSMRYPRMDQSSKMLLVLRGDRIYLLESFSVYPDHPSFENLVTSFAFVDPPAST